MQKIKTSKGAQGKSCWPATFDRKEIAHITASEPARPHGPYPQTEYGWHFLEEIPEKFRNDPGNALKAFPGIPQLRVQLESPKPYNLRHLRRPDHFQNSLPPPSTAGGASFFQKWFRRGPLRAGHGFPSSTEGMSDLAEVSRALRARNAEQVSKMSSVSDRPRNPEKSREQSGKPPESLRKVERVMSDLSAPRHRIRNR